ncbi:MAG TPA: hypothetical protein VNP72_05595 [Longimicrobium sp.]|nr:hypothetical protein [Longimicrobium sp.]
MQSKLRLDLDQLQVESFDTHPGEAQKRGTVHGHQQYCYYCCCYPCCCGGGTAMTGCGQNTCQASCNGTCYASCNGTCDASCNGTCGATCDYSACYGSCDYTCDGCTMYDGTCRGYGTCGIYPCRAIP